MLSFSTDCLILTTELDVQLSTLLKLSQISIAQRAERIGSTFQFFTIADQKHSSVIQWSFIVIDSHS